MIEKGADVNARYYNGVAALMIAAGNSLDEIAKLLIENGADVNARNDFGDSALMQAARKGVAKIAKLLIENGANVNAKDDHAVNALLRAVMGNNKNNNIDIVKLLIEKGAKIKEGAGYWGFVGGFDALGIVNEYGHDEIAKLLKAIMDADVKAKDKGDKGAPEQQGVDENGRR